MQFTPTDLTNRRSCSTVFIEKKSACKQTYQVQIHVVQGSTVIKKKCKRYLKLSYRNKEKTMHKNWGMEKETATPLQYSCLAKSMDRGVCQAAGPCGYMTEQRVHEGGGS